MMVVYERCLRVVARLFQAVIGPAFFHLAPASMPWARSLHGASPFGNPLPWTPVTGSILFYRGVSACPRPALPWGVKGGSLRTLVTRTLRLLLAWLCLVAPWLAVPNAAVTLAERNVPAEERDSSGEELDEVALSGSRRTTSHRQLRPRSRDAARQLQPWRDVPRTVEAPPTARLSYSPPAKVLLRRVAPRGEDPFS